MQDMSDLTHTYNGVEITEGLRVFTNDWAWGTVLPFSKDKIEQPWFSGWYDVMLDSGKRGMYNGTRMTTVRLD